MSFFHSLRRRSGESKNKRERLSLAGGGLKIVLMEKLLPHHHKNRREISYEIVKYFYLASRYSDF
jgi:hypothetical protein